MRWALTIMVPLVIVGVVGGLVAIRARESDAAFLLAQQHPARVEPQALALVVAKAPEPTPSGPGSRATRAACRSGAATTAGNPWTCTVLYASHRTIGYRIEVAPSGGFTGSDASGQHVIRGCCVAGAGGAAGG